MNYYYLISQLPSLDGIGDNSAVPITEEAFNELCNRFLGKKSLSIFNKLSLKPSKKRIKTGSALLDTWNDGERRLRMALGKIRAERMNKEFDCEDMSLSEKLLDIASRAVEIKDPLEAERFLDSYRLAFLEELRPSDAFCEDSLYYYGIKLKLLLRLRQFDEEIGKAEYKRIYNSIIRNERTEVV